MPSSLPFVSSLSDILDRASRLYALVKEHGQPPLVPRLQVPLDALPPVLPWGLLHHHLLPLFPPAILALHPALAIYALPSSEGQPPRLELALQHWGGQVNGEAWRMLDADEAEDHAAVAQYEYWLGLDIPKRVKAKLKEEQCVLKERILKRWMRLYVWPILLPHPAGQFAHVVALSRSDPTPPPAHRLSDPSDAASDASRLAIFGYRNASPFPPDLPPLVSAGNPALAVDLGVEYDPDPSSSVAEPGAPLQTTSSGDPAGGFGGSTSLSTPAASEAGTPGQWGDGGEAASVGLLDEERSGLRRRTVKGEEARRPPSPPPSTGELKDVGHSLHELLSLLLASSQLRNLLADSLNLYRARDLIHTLSNVGRKYSDHMVREIHEVAGQAVAGRVVDKERE
ncbi:hypothetical protein JCM10207_008871 [Rhodosporidiobolus poonsookiae]